MKELRASTRPSGVCPILWFNRIVGGKYKLWIVHELKDGPLRYGALRRGLVDATMEKAVTARTLSRELKDLASLGLVRRKEFPGVPPKVEYSLAADGKRLIPVIQGMVLWVFGKAVPDVPFPIKRPRTPVARKPGPRLETAAAL
jgi:DNA-binding HxlR family transcriptional regulator